MPDEIVGAHRILPGERGRSCCFDVHRVSGPLHRCVDRDARAGGHPVRRGAVRTPSLGSVLSGPAHAVPFCSLQNGTVPRCAPLPSCLGLTGRFEFWHGANLVYTPGANETVPTGYAAFGRAVGGEERDGRLRSLLRTPPACEYWVESGPKKARIPLRARITSSLAVRA
jgi:hypothetical protein